MSDHQPQERSLLAVTQWCRRVAEAPRFQNIVLAVIVLNAVLVGVETSPEIVQRQAALFTTLNTAVIVVFVAELIFRLAGHQFRLISFLRDGWNLFDAVIVILSLLPGVGPFATVARVGRVLRVARLVSVSPKLRLIVGTMMRSIPSLAHVSLLLGLLLYIYAVLGVNLFGAVDKQHWGSLGTALLTLFQMLTLEGWVELQAASLEVTRWAWVYYGSFVIIAVFVVVNLFIAVVLNNLDEIREEDRRAAAEQERRNQRASGGVLVHLSNLRAELERLEALVRDGATSSVVELRERTDLDRAG